jgi:hypothetical protein
MKLQARIGLILCLFSLAVFVLQLLFYTSVTHTLTGFFTLDRLSYALYSLVFLLSMFVNYPITKGIQVSIIAIEGLIDLSYPTDQFAGFVMLIVAIFLLCAYGSFTTYKWIKVSISLSVLYVLFVLFPFRDASNAFITSAEWIGLILAFLLLSWAIFKDYIDQLKSSNKALHSIAKEAISVAKDTIKLEDGPHDE